MCPRISSICRPEVSYTSMSGFLSIVSNILTAAACPAANAVKLGDACPRDLANNNIQEKVVMLNIFLTHLVYIF